MSPAFEYERDPKRIYEMSFAAIDDELSEFDIQPELRPMALRLIHACGMVEIAKDLRSSAGAVAAGIAALNRGAPILCDTEMVAQGIIRRGLPAGAKPIVTLNAPGVADRAREISTTRSAAAVEFWRPKLAGAIVAIGNAPTALFQLLENLDDGWPAPALILGFPVGFVGAAESKECLAGFGRGIPFVTLLGRRGGSAMAAAAVNALSLGLAGDGT
ncbi:MAG: precorrin-8X methylmutase [Pseudomonadota bacterium]